MSYIPSEIIDLIHKYMSKYKKRPRPYNEDQWKDFDEYKEYLQKELKKVN